MKTRILHLWDTLYSNLWFVPATMVAATCALSFGTLSLDWAWKERFEGRPEWIWGGGPEGAREILSTIAGAMMTVTGVVFSITLAVLTLASSQFGPRLLRNFMRDTGNKVVLGTFLSTFTYALLILRAIRTEDGQFAASISVSVAIALALTSLGVLIYFIHHVANSIQAPIVIARVSDELDRGIDRLFPGKLGEAVESPGVSAEEEAIRARLEREGYGIRAAKSGYLQAIDQEGLLEIATGRNLVIGLRHRPGHFITMGNDLAVVWPGREADDPELTEELNSLFLLGPERTEEQDVEFSIHQLTEVAVRALSPGINDPFTALNCVDRVGDALSRLAERSLPSPYRYDSEHNLRVIAPGVTFPGLLDAAFNQIRQYGRSSASVTIRLLETLAVIARHVRRNEDRIAMRQHATMIANGSQEALPEPRDRRDVQERYRNVFSALDDGVLPEQLARQLQAS